MGDSIHDMSLLVGTIMGKLEALTSSVEQSNRVVESLDRKWGEREHDAVEGRRRLHDKVEGVILVVHSLKTDIMNVSNELFSIKPHVETLRNEREQHVGAARLGKRAWIGLIGISGLAGGGFGELIRTFWRH